MNKAIKHNLKRKLKNLKEKWADDLSEVLWAFKTTTKSTTEETLFSLAYRYKAMIPVEIGAGSSRRDNFDSEQNMILQRRDFISSKKNDVTPNFGSQRTNDALLGTSTQT